MADNRIDVDEIPYSPLEEQLIAVDENGNHIYDHEIVEDNAQGQNESEPTEDSTDQISVTPTIQAPNLPPPQPMAEPIRAPIPPPIFIQAPIQAPPGFPTHMHTTFEIGEGSSKRPLPPPHNDFFPRKYPKFPRYTPLDAKPVNGRSSSRDPARHRWGDLKDLLYYWKKAEGIERSELYGAARGSSCVPSLTGEHLHETVPLLVARLARAERRLEVLEYVDYTGLAERMYDIEDKIEEESLQIHTTLGRIDDLEGGSGLAKVDLLLKDKRIEHLEAELENSHAQIDILWTAVLEMMERQTEQEMRTQRSDAVLEAISNAASGFPPNSSL